MKLYPNLPNVSMCCAKYDIEGTSSILEKKEGL